jgi:hypothetical protein
MTGMPSEKTNDATRREWRELGFFYDRDDTRRRWLLASDRVGLQRFSALLRAYTADPANDRPSEHCHYGPYMYLEVMTWPEPGIDDHSIHGTIGDLMRLADIVDATIAGLAPSDEARIDQQYSSACTHSLVLRLEPDGFDPAAADPMLPSPSG